MKSLTIVAGIVVIGGIALQSPARAFDGPVRARDCSDTSDYCVVKSGEELYNFNRIGNGNDTVVLGQVSVLFGRTLAACVNGVLEFATDPFALFRPQQTKDGVICLGGGNDNARVLNYGETFTCTSLGLPVNMYSWKYNDHKLTIYGQAGNDTIKGADGDDSLCGGSGDDRLSGDMGHNELAGGPGNDRLLGLYSVDWLYGGAGNDSVVDLAAGGDETWCKVGGDPNVTPPQVMGGDGDDCVQISTRLASDFCYAQIEDCTLPGIVCSAGLDCGNGTDILYTDTTFGARCETKTWPGNCPRP